jgi:hypothetical protein
MKEYREGVDGDGPCGCIIVQPRVANMDYLLGDLEIAMVRALLAV